MISTKKLAAYLINKYIILNEPNVFLQTVYEIIYYLCKLEIFIRLVKMVEAKKLNCEDLQELSWELFIFSYNA